MEKIMAEVLHGGKLVENRNVGSTDNPSLFSNQALEMSIFLKPFNDVFQKCLHRWERINGSQHFLMLWPYHTAPHTVVTLNPKIIFTATPEL